MNKNNVNLFGIISFKQIFFLLIVLFILFLAICSGNVVFMVIAMAVAFAYYKKNKKNVIKILDHLKVEEE